ncbi:MAG TPA: ATP synthase F1 subunit delta [Blastocatellia bacterium]|nr:ATP synthase F1 subunit delta [Blastocatellia bacterium]
MSVTTIANRYAHALADVILERREVSEVTRELSDFARLMQQNEELHGVFSSPAIPLARKRGVLDALLSRLRLRQTSSNFLQLLLSNYRLHHLPEVLGSLSKELDDRAGIISAEVTTARPLNDQNREMLNKRLREVTGREVRLQFRTDPELIGGVVTRIGSLVFDGSIKTQLAQMKRRLAKGAVG